jgi:hypothetical protein
VRIAKARAALPCDLSDRIAFRVASAEDVDAPAASFELALFSSSL